MEPFASGLIGEMRRLDSEHKERKRTKDVLVATLVSAPGLAELEPILRWYWPCALRNVPK